MDVEQRTCYINFNYSLLLVPALGFKRKTLQCDSVWVYYPKAIWCGGHSWRWGVWTCHGWESRLIARPRNLCCTRIHVVAVLGVEAAPHRVDPCLAPACQVSGCTIGVAVATARTKTDTKHQASFGTTSLQTKHSLCVLKFKKIRWHTFGTKRFKLQIFQTYILNKKKRNDGLRVAKRRAPIDWSVSW